MKQKSLFELEFSEQQPDWIIDEQETLHIAKVVFPEPPDGVFDYKIPDELSQIVVPGVRLKVPLGKSNRSVLAYCTAVETRKIKSETARKRLKTIQSVVDFHSLLSEKMLNLASWIADYYLCPLGQVFDAILPAGVRSLAGTRNVKILSLGTQASSLQIGVFTDKIHSPLNNDALLRAGKMPAIPAQARCLRSQGIINALQRSTEPLTAAELARTAKCSISTVNTLIKKGVLIAKTVRRDTGIGVIDRSKMPKETGHELNCEQQDAFDKICSVLKKDVHKTFLLHGVTGSGKTEVYIRAIEETVKFGRQAIVLVPEISLTPQTVSRFAGRFDSIAVLHSHLTDAQRSKEWHRISSGSVDVVVGARSAIFAPLQRLGLIVIDEEHENTFKQETMPRYHARNVAVERAKSEHVPLILGSATPSLESWHAADCGEYELISMPNRVLNRRLPDVKIVDMRESLQSRFVQGAIRQPLYRAMKDALCEDGQIILLLNRRGYSTHLQCPVCGDVVKCPNCDISLTHHQSENTALCHYCDYQMQSPNKCDGCSATGIRYSGLGTQKLETEVKARFAGVPVLRMDADTMQAHGSHEKALAAFRSGEYKILLGTQMIAKGLDFPNVTLVGVINADTALHFPDFRAAERTFHLVTQVAGRTGRGEKGGFVLVQTYNPENEAIRAASQHDYARFVAQELPMRKQHGYPPFAKMARIIIRSEDENKAKEFAAQFGSLALCARTNVKILGPAPAPIAKLRSMYRFHLQITAPNSETLLAVIREKLSKISPPESVQFLIDIDPLDMQ